VATRYVVLAAAALLGAPMVIACAAIAGLGDVPILSEGGSGDAMTDSGFADHRMADAPQETAADAHEIGVDAPPECQMATDCPAGRACDPTTGACSKSCSAEAACNGGCCTAMVGGTCVSGDDSTACGNGSVCLACEGATSTCVGGVCSGACTGAGCAAGLCCTGSGSCEPGDAATACGSMAACMDCTASSRGARCLPDEKCGCLTAADCPPQHACSPTTQTCTTLCGTDAGSLECNGGCCNGKYCAAGTKGYACGVSGACVDCSEENGTACLPTGACGCATEADCHEGYACMGGACTKSCNASSPCHATCCKGTCQPGTGAGACGKSGMCKDCTSTCSPGLECLFVPDGGEYVCGCTNPAGCASSACAGPGCAGFVTGSPGKCN
jgi:hypothetical protein